MKLDITYHFNGQYFNSIFDYDIDGKILNQPNYFLLNANISKRISSYLKSYFAVRNIFDENYYHRLGYPREGRTWHLGIKFGLFK